MAKTLKHVYTWILFLSLFLIAKEVVAYFKCLDSYDCPKVPDEKTFLYECINYRCELFLLESVPLVPMPLIE
ncbi:unnamed protein product [Trifolium pratense]|uniref:Uncharacterized protein n=1 Tax=Trifolium pratense TaxID=57577 RepID=A0ACB0JT74_TRIPR|nr:unnamed protein product [Trifolium pratense]